MKRIALRTLIGSVAISALLGIYAIVAGDFGDFEIRVFFTSLIISGVSVLAMACGAAAEGGGFRQASRWGTWTAIATGALTLVGMWGKIRGDEFWKTVGCVGIVAGALTHAALVSMARVAARFRWAQVASYIVSAVLAGLLIVAIVLEIDDESFYRFVAVLSILLTAATVAIPVFHRMSRMDGVGADVTVRFCPKCGAALSQPTECGGCHAQFRVDWIA